MARGRPWVFFSVLVLLLLVVSACGPSTVSTPTPTSQAPTKTGTSPTASPTVKPTAAPTPTATAKATATAPSGVSFAGKTVTLLVSLSPGGGTDIMARLYSMYLGRFLPGNPNVIVRNMPGGDGVIGGNYYIATKPDGLNVLVGTGSLAFGDLLKKAALKFSFADLTALIANTQANFYYVAPQVLDKPDDIMKAKGLIFGHSGGGTAAIFVAAKELLNFPTDKIILAYGGSGDARRAFLSGEITCTGDSLPAYSETGKALEEKGQIKIIFQSGVFDSSGNLIRQPGLPPGVPTVKDVYEKVYGKSPEGIVFDAYKGAVAVGSNYDKPLLLHGTTPDNIKKVYFAAAEAMLKDPAFKKSAENLVGTDATWRAGEAFAAQFKKDFGMKPETREWFRNIMSTKYGMIIE